MYLLTDKLEIGAVVEMRGWTGSKVEYLLVANVEGAILTYVKPWRRWVALQIFLLRLYPQIRQRWPRLYSVGSAMARRSRKVASTYHLLRAFKNSRVRSVIKSVTVLVADRKRIPLSKKRW